MFDDIAFGAVNKH